MKSRIKNIFKLFIFSMLIADISLAAEQQTKSQEPIIVPLSQGQLAPWPGVLLNSAAVGNIKFDYEHAQEKVDIAVQKAVSDVITQKTSEIDILKSSCDSILSQKNALLEEKDSQLALFRDENKKLREELANFPSKSVWFSIGFTGGILITVTTVFAIVQATK